MDFKMKIEKNLGILEIAKQVIISEAKSLLDMASNLEINFENAINLIQERKGRIAIIGMGKSGIIGKKIAATLSSTGTSSFFVHPGEAFHGDLGMIKPSDVAILISNSGETEEIIRLIPFFQWRGNKTIAMTGNTKSTLAKNADVVLDISVEREACNNNLAPTNSTTATLVMGDALAITLSTLNGFKPEDFARFHPGGNLGRRLLTKVRDVMHTKELPICSPECEFHELVQIMTAGRLGLALVLKEDRLIGIITDGDLRRKMQKVKNPLTLIAEDIMTSHPKTIEPDSLFSSAEEKMKEQQISSLIVVNEVDRVVGVLNIYSA